MNRKQQVFRSVQVLYEMEVAKGMGRWMWDNHVQWVADKSVELANKYDADTEKVYCAAMLHDLADCKLERGDDDFDAWSESKGREILESAGFDEAEMAEIIEVIIRPHSCRPDNLPTTQEGKVLATADGMFHLQTGFFAFLCYEQKPDYTENYKDWQEWFSEHVERDFGPKIFFADEKEEVRADYEALCRVFENKSLDDK